VKAEGESPDFICEDAAGFEVGVELVRAMANPESLFWRKTLDGYDSADSLDTWILAQGAIHEKEIKRLRPHWMTPFNTMLVVQLVDCPLEEIVVHIEPDLIAECSECGFVEIWLADYTTLEAYSTVQLYGVKAKGFEGLHERHLGSWKPYG
jgi:hypothetical protein